MARFSFQCGCSFEILKELQDGRQPLCKFALKDINYNCAATWKIFKDGLNAGIFQLESNLGKHFMKELAPESVEHLSALGAILRPGCLDFKDEKGISMTQKYCNRKNKREEIPPVAPAIAASLASSFNILIYQEQFMNLAKELAGFDLKEVDRLRKATGKKDQKEMSEIMKIFKEKALAKAVISEAEIDTVIENIKATARYSFNRAHSMAYSGLRTYWTAYIKSHFPLAFFTSKLKGAKFKIDAESSIQDLISETKLFNVEVKLPDIRDCRPYFFTDGKCIKYGLCDVKGIGESTFKRIKAVIQNLDWSKLNFFDFATRVAMDKITDSSVNKLIEGGALSFLGLTRTQMLAEYQFVTNLNTNERENLTNILTATSDIRDFDRLFKDFVKLKKEGGIASSKKRLDFLESYGKTLVGKTDYVDSPIWLAAIEERLLNYPISCQRVDACDTSFVNMSCKEFLSGAVKEPMVFGVDIVNVIEKVIKKGNNEGKKFLSIKLTDGTCTIDAVVWPEIYLENQGLLTEKNSVIIQGSRNYKKKDNVLVINRVWQAV